ncbi:MAG: glutamine--fructose-6-phosphate transaminase (isomerizing) [Chloroflexota bacterium]
MCGIVGYVGPRQAAPILLDGLQRLEYRGYDSAGIAVFQEGHLERRRCVGKLAGLRKAIEESPVTGTVGIGHTRWATHGKPSETNAHPHVDCRRETVVIHNGIVENYLALKEELLARGHVFASETDTEVIPHLVEQYLAEDPQAGFFAAARRALARLKGAHAIVLMGAQEPGAIVAARLGNAGGVVVGLGEGENFVASDVPAILSHTRQMVFLDNRELAVVAADRVRYFTLEGAPLAKAPESVAWDPVAAEKRGYKHFMQKEICEQPRSLTDTLRGRVDFATGDIYLEGLRLTPEELATVDRVAIVACGTAYYAGLIGKYMIEELARLPVEVDYGSEFRYRNPLVNSRALALAITQSGETVDTLAAMQEAKGKGARLVAIVNAIGSQASRLAQGLIYMHAGPEIAVASTKAFTSSLVDLLLLGLHLGTVRGTLNHEQLRTYAQALAELPEKAGQVLADQAIYEELAHRYHRAKDFLFLGRGIQYPVALEGAHKLKEISYIHAEGCPAGEMKHGINALIDENLPVVAVAVRDKVYEKMLSNIEQVRARDGQVIAVASQGDERIADKCDHVIHVPSTAPLLEPVLTTIPLQLLAYHLAVRRGCDVDQPRNLAKSVTVE